MVEQWLGGGWGQENGPDCSVNALNRSWRHVVWAGGQTLEPVFLNLGAVQALSPLYKQFCSGRR